MRGLEKKEVKEHSRTKRKKEKSRVNLWAVNGVLNWPISEQ